MSRNTNVKTGAIGLLLGVVGVTAEPIRAHADAPSRRCIIAVDITESVLGTQSPAEHWKSGINQVINECKDAQMRTSLFVISSMGVGDYEPKSLDFETNKDRRKANALRGLASKWLVKLTPDKSGSSDILSTLSTISTELRSESPTAPHRIVLFTDGIQTAEYSFLKNQNPDRVYFTKLLATMDSDGAVFSFPKGSKVEFRGFAKPSSNNVNERMKSGVLEKLIADFWTSYFKRSQVSAPKFITTAAI
jgi:hypothetical protein